MDVELQCSRLNCWVSIASSNPMGLAMLHFQRSFSVSRALKCTPISVPQSKLANLAELERDIASFPGSPTREQKLVLFPYYKRHIAERWPENEASPCQWCVNAVYIYMPKGMPKTLDAYHLLLGRGKR